MGHRYVIWLVITCHYCCAMFAVVVASFSKVRIQLNTEIICENNLTYLILDNQGKRSKRSSGPQKEIPTISYNHLIVLVRGIFESDSSDLCQHRMLCQLAITTLPHTGIYKEI